MVNDPTQRRSHRRLVAGLVLAIGVASLFLVWFLYSPGDPGALRISASLNETLVPRGHDVGVTVTLRNTLPRFNNLPFNFSTTSLLARYNLTSGGCSAYPVGIGLLSGNYSLNDLASADWLSLSQPGTFYCTPAVPIDSYQMSPLQQTSLFYVINGYWTVGSQKSTVSYGTLNPLEPGAYTLVVGDFWGQIELFHFTVGA